MSARVLFFAWCMLAPSWTLAQVTISSGAGDVATLFNPDPPGIELHPNDPNLAFVAELLFPPVNGVEPVGVDPNAAIALPAPGVPLFDLPADLNGADPNSTGGAILDDVWPDTPTLFWVTTSGFESVVPYDPTTGQAIDVTFEGLSRKSVPTEWTFAGSYADTGNNPQTSLTTRFTSGVLRIGNKLLVSTSNVRFPGPVGDPGTVLLFDIVDPDARPLVITRASPAVLLTSDANPTALTPLGNGLVAVTNTGLIAFTNPVSPLTNGSIDVIDAASASVRASIPLGLANPSFKPIALAPDGAVGVVGSASLRQLYALDLRDVETLPATTGDFTLQRTSCNDTAAPVSDGVLCLGERVIRGVSNPIAIAPAPGLSGSDGFIVQARFGASGRFFAATALDDGLLAVGAFDDRNTDTPHPLLASRFGATTSLVVTPPISTPGFERGPGPLVLRASDDGELADTDAIWLTRTPDGSVMRGRLGGSLATPTGDGDSDGTEDALDNCPSIGNPTQSDVGAVGVGGPDGIGDACQCGDVSDDGWVDAADVTALRVFLTGASALAAPAKCDVSGGGCDLVDRVLLGRALAALGPPMDRVCPE